MFDLKTLQRMGAGNICFPKKCNRLFVHTHQFEKINNTGTNKIVFSGDGQREVSSWGLNRRETPTKPAALMPAASKPCSQQALSI